MALPWVRLGTEVPRNHKILSLLQMSHGRETAFVWTCSLAYSGEQGLNGFIPKTALPFIHGKPVDAKRLVEVGLWEVAGAGGWQIHDWAEYQPSSEEHQRRSAKASAAANARWERERLRKMMPQEDAHA